MTTGTHHRFEARLLDALLDHHPARTGDPAARPNPWPGPRRPRRRPAWRLPLAAATALAAAAAGLAATGVFTTRSAGGVLDATTLAYRASQALSRIQPGDIQFTKDVTSVGSTLIVNLMWQRSTGQGSNTVQAWRQEQFYKGPRPAGDQLQLTKDRSAVYRNKAVTGKVVDYAHHAWWADNYSYPYAYPPQPTVAEQVSDIRQLLQDGTFYVVGRVWLHGRPTIEIARRDQWVRIWLDPQTYLIVQDQQRHQQPGPGPLGQMVDDTEISWLPPTAANLSQLTAPVPPGFRKLPHPPPWCVRC